MIGIVLSALAMSANTYESLEGCCRADGVQDEGTFTFFKDAFVSNEDCRDACDETSGCVAYENSPSSRCEIHTKPIAFAEASCASAGFFCARVTSTPTAP